MTFPTWLTIFNGIVRTVETLKNIFSNPLSYLSNTFFLFTGFVYISIGFISLVIVKMPDFLPTDVLMNIYNHNLDHPNNILVFGCIFLILGILVLGYLGYKIFIDSKKSTQHSEEPQDKTSELKVLVESRVEEILEKINSGEKNITSLINGNNARLFKDESEVYEYIVSRYEEVRKSIDITHFGSGAFRDKNDGTFNSKFCKALVQIIKQGEIRVRRVSLIRDDDQLALIQEMMQDYKDNPKLFIGCHSGKSLNVYLTSLMIIDDIEVLVTYTEKNLKDYRTTLSIKNPIVVNFYQNYFNSLYKESYIVKSENNADENVFNKLRSEIYT